MNWRDLSDDALHARLVPLVGHERAVTLTWHRDLVDTAAQIDALRLDSDANPR